jgi:hypothetical protein
VTRLRKGDRIRLVHMPDDPDPIRPGTEGTVECVRWVDGGGQHGFLQVDVNWDDGRRLMLSIPPDEVEQLSASTGGSDG